MRIVVLGCGYVGLELGRRLRDDHDVVGVRRSSEGIEAIEDAGLDAVRADVTDPDALDAVPDADALVFAASAGRGVEPARRTYVEGLEAAVGTFAAREDPPDRLLYTSSTGVYGDHGGAWVDETTPPEPGTERGRILLEAERIARAAAEHGIDPTVVRFAGLYGPDRYRLERYLDGPVPGGHLNLLHRDDAAGVLAFFLREGPEVVVAVDGEPVDRRDLAAWLAEQCGVEPPETVPLEEYAEAGSRLAAQKRCSNDRLRGFGYEFEYPTYREGYRAAVEAYRGESSYQ